MEIKRYFEELQTKLELLDQYYAKGLLSNHVYEKELNELVKTSEIILEEWIKFEEALSQVGQVSFKNEFSWMDKHAKLSLTQSPATFAHHFWSYQSTEGGTLKEWEQGKAFYHLMMFSQAIPLLEKVLDSNPDFELARLFLAHSLLATQQLEKAKYHLQFLLNTTRSDDLYHLAANGLACLEGTLKAYDLAHHYFEKIDLMQVRQEWRALFTYNHALTLYQLKWFNQSEEKWRTYIQLSPQDWKGYYWLGRVYHQQGDEEKACLCWFEALQVEEHPQLLKHMARYYEQKGLYQMAIHCYQRLFKGDGRSNDLEAWIGLAWCYGLARHMEKSQDCFLKALSLSLEDLTLQLAYAWMLLYWNQKEKARSVIAKLEQKAPKHPLVRGLKDLSVGRWIPLEQISNSQ
jgi:tetratricopeptide (TPR) repeat protein